MKKIFLALFAPIALMMIAACDNYETYAEQKDKERAAITRFIKDSAINVINEATFRQQNYTSDVSKNQYVLFASSGVYMQIVRKGCGEVIKDGERTTVLCRFTEKNIFTDSLALTNDVLSFSSIVDKMTVTRVSDTFTASFTKGESLMYSAYGSAEVPSGWLSPLLYINIGRQTKPDEEIAKVNLIVPHDRGTQMHRNYVRPSFFVITYERGR